jgi:copper resistance protein C
VRRHLAAGTVVLFGMALGASAHALLESAIPRAGSTVSGPDVAIILHFNARIDSQRSKLDLVTPQDKVLPLKMDPQESAGSLNAHANGLGSGSYSLRWQALAVDGHITRGEVAFAVR